MGNWSGDKTLQIYTFESVRCCFSCDVIPRGSYRAHANCSTRLCPDARSKWGFFQYRLLQRLAAQPHLTASYASRRVASRHSSTKELPTIDEVYTCRGASNHHLTAILFSTLSSLKGVCCFRNSGPCVRLFRRRLHRVHQPCEKSPQCS